MVMSAFRPKIPANEVTLEQAEIELIDCLVEEEISDIATEIGFDLYFGIENELDLTEENELDPELENASAPNLDIFGQLLGKKTTFEIECPNCKRTLAAVRFAPHLEKCMGMGRNSSRIASRRLAASAGNTSSAAFVSSTEISRVSPGPSTSNGPVTSTGNNHPPNHGDIPSEDDHYEDGDDDEDWTMEKKKRGKRTMEKGSSRRKGGSRSRKHAEGKSKRSSSPSVSTTYSPSSSVSFDPNDETSNFSTTSSH